MGDEIFEESTGSSPASIRSITIHPLFRERIGKEEENNECLELRNSVHDPNVSGVLEKMCGTHLRLGFHREYNHDQFMEVFPSLLACN